ARSNASRAPARSPERRFASPDANWDAARCRAGQDALQARSKARAASIQLSTRAAYARFSGVGWTYASIACQPRRGSAGSLDFDDAGAARALLTGLLVGACDCGVRLQIRIPRATAAIASEETIQRALALLVGIFTELMTLGSIDAVATRFDDDVGW